MTLTLPDRAAPEVSQPRSRRTLAGLWAVPEVRWAAVATLLFAAGGAAQLAGAPAVVFWVLYLACYVTGGWEPAWAGLQALRAKTLDVDLLMIVAAIAAASIGQVFDGALLIVIFATSGALEAWATRRTADSVRALLDLTPGQATRLTEGSEQVVPAAELRVGDRVLVRPGELLPADGTVEDGASDVDQASITGEPLPVAKLVGDEVFAGTMNGTGALTVRVERAPADSVLARIVTMVEQASATKAKTQLFIEKVEQRYSIGVVVGTVALIAVPLLVLGAEFQPTLLRAMTFMIVASPCAVVLATMPPLLASIANAGRHGVLVKSAVVMEKLADIEAVAFDKTGTLTEGQPRLAELQLLPGSAYPTDTLLALAAAAEDRSEHPIGVAVAAAARRRKLTLSTASDFTSAPGRGVSATVDGHRIAIGSPIQVDALTRTGPGRNPPGLRELVARVEAHGSTAVVLVVDDGPEAVLALSDNLRPDAARAVEELTLLTGRSPVLLSGDNPDAVRAVGAEVGISDVHGGLLPQDKVAAVTALQREQRTLLVGDGVNDAPALATAHVGVAMGRRGSDLALETADAVIVHDELTALPAVLRLARRARRVVTTNLVIAGAVIITLICWDLIGDLPLVVGVAGHETSTVIVGLNGLRLLRRRAWTHS